LARLTGLTHLDIGDNQLAGLPEWIADLGRLEWLEAESNQLTEVPGSLRELRSLHYLEVSGNSILELPPSLGELPDLWGLGVQANPLAPEVLAAAEEGTDALLEFLRLLQTDGERIHECKLILVGEGAAGKSSLLAALRGEPWVENRDTTHGIQIK